jgi:hypothetical protein
MNSMIDSLFDQYERGGMTRRHLVQALAVLVLPERALAQATDAGTGIHMDLPDGYISVDSVAEKKGVITHFAVAVDHMDRVAAKRLADKINSEFPDAKARDAYQANTGGSTVNLRDPDGFFVQISSKDGR